MLIKKCENCGKIFAARSEKRKFCSKACKNEYMQALRDAESQPCWTCSKGVRECSWIRDLTPVDGWSAEKVIKREEDGYIRRTYKIKSCPLYIYG